MRAFTPLCLALAMVAAAFAGEANVDELVKQLEGPNPPENLDAAYSQVLDAWLPKMSSDNMGDRQGPEQAFQNLCWSAGAPGAEARRLAVCKAMVARLAKPELPKWPRVWFLKQLQHIGKAESVECMAALLADKDELVRESARRALQKSPTPEATAKLLAALDGATDAQWRVGLINALGDRGDAAALKTLLKLAADGDDDVRSAAVLALAKIGDKAAADPIAAAMAKGSDHAKVTATDSYLRLAEKLVAKGDKAAALPIYRKLLEAPGHVRCAAVIGLGRAGGTAELDAIFATMADKDEKLRGAALYALGQLPGREVSAAIVAKMKTAEPALKVVLLQALALGGDKEALPAFLAAAADADESVRIAAYEGMAALGNEAAAPALIAALVSKADRELEAARLAVNQIPGDAVTAALIKAFDTAPPAGKVQLIGCLAARRTPSVAPALLKAATDADAAVRTEAFKALADVADASALPAIVKLLVGAKDDGERAAAERTITSIARRMDTEDQRTEAVLAALPGAGVPARVSLLRIAANLGGAKALAAVRAAMKDPAPEVQEAAFRALPNWADPSVARDLLDIAKSDAPLARRVLAIRGAVDVASKTGGLAPDEMQKIFESAMAAAPRPEDKKMVLGAMANVANLGVLDLALKYLTDPALKAEAEIAAVRVARAVSGSYQAKAREVLKNLAELSDNDQVKKEASEAIALLDRFEDYITSWLVSGPYRQGDKDGPGLFDFAFPPEKPGDTTAKWAAMPIGTDKGRPWLIEFDKTPGIAGQNAVVYLRTRVQSPAKQEARIEAGSDDGIKVWLNGKVVHANNATRPCSPGSDKAKVTLNEGWNDLLVKVTQGGGEWSVCLRFRGPNGERLVGLVGDPNGK
ncbi:MAG TPA: HEAT repeat domain-containing protein [Planctomycetota bacterium]|nr:HEAT repeat domain-containing protein [Planctomycetota bacterium]